MEYEYISEWFRFADMDLETAEYIQGFDKIEQACSSLTRYGVQPRYPQEIGVTEIDTQKALEYARQIRDFEPLDKVRREINK